MYLGWEIHNYMSPDLSQPYLFDWMNKDVSESYKEYIQQIAAKTTCEEGVCGYSPSSCCSDLRRDRQGLQSAY